jgi:hypothetical protein
MYASETGKRSMRSKSSVCFKSKLGVAWIVGFLFVIKVALSAI